MFRSAVFLALIATGRMADVVAAVPETMRTAAFERGGGPEVLTIHELPIPQLAADEVLISVQAAGVASWDADIRRNVGISARGPVVLGSDGAGTIVATGPEVRDFKIGDRVYGTANGFYSEYVKVRADRIAQLPREMDFSEAGVLAIGGLSALQGIEDILGLKPGETLIIHGAAGSVGSLAVQLAKFRHVRVLATAVDDEGLAFARRLGADEVVNGRTGDIAAAARKFAPQGVDAVLGLAGGTALETCIDALRRDGHGRVAYLYGLNPVPRPRNGMRMTLYSFTPGTRELEKLNKAVEQAKLHVPVAAEYPLERAEEAHRRLEAGNVLGKMVLRISTGTD